MPKLPSFLQKIKKHMQPQVFISSGLVVIGFVIFGGFWSETAASTFQAIQSWIVTYLGWFYILAASVILLFVIYLLFSKYGKIKLGGDEEKPEFSNFTWFTMLFSAGMGTGLVFWGVAEPVMHYHNPPLSEPQTNQALLDSFKLSFFHWGLHPWAIYTLFGLGIAFYHFRLKLPLAPRSLLYPIIGDRIYGWIGHLVDTLCTVGTLFGVATSLGLGAMQINAGIAQLSQIGLEVNVQLILIAVITGFATSSVVLGISKGISRLSRLNIILAILLLVFVLTAGPTLYLLKLLVSSTGNYLQNLVQKSFWINPIDPEWQKDWTLFYWAWWISWSPFVGVFTARVSRGRTVRQYVTWVLLLPTAVTFIWLSVFGGSAIHQIVEQGISLYQPIKEEVATSLHELLSHLPLASISSVLATLLITIYFITSSDSGSLVDDMVTSGGDPNPPVAQRVFWAVSEGAVAATLLVAGGLQALRTASLTSGLPLAIILILTAFGILKSFRKEIRKKR